MSSQTARRRWNRNHCRRLSVCPRRASNGDTHHWLSTRSRVCWPLPDSLDHFVLHRFVTSSLPLMSRPTLAMNAAALTCSSGEVPKCLSYCLFCAYIDCMAVACDVSMSRESKYMVDASRRALLSCKVVFFFSLSSTGCTVMILKLSLGIVIWCFLRE